MHRRVESIVLKTSLRTPERGLPDEAAADSDSWVVLIGEGSDAGKTLEFLRSLWPEVEGETAEVGPAFARAHRRRKLSARSANVDPVALRDAAEGDP
jgi:adenine/guanine phosphoribosyltransferase-like PRPP-binding protein